MSDELTSYEHALLKAMADLKRDLKELKELHKEDKPCTDDELAAFKLKMLSDVKKGRIS